MRSSFNLVASLLHALQTVRFKNELERNITIKLGYANAKIFMAVEGAVPGPGNFRSENAHEKVTVIHAVVASRTRASLA